MCSELSSLSRVEVTILNWKRLSSLNLLKICWNVLKESVRVVGLMVWGSWGVEGCSNTVSSMLKWRDRFPLLVLMQCHLVVLQRRRKCVCVPFLLLPLSFSQASFMSLPSLFILCWLCVSLLASLCSRFFCFLLVTSVYVYPSRCLCFVTLSSVCACRHQWHSQTGCPPWHHKVTWNARWEEKCQGAIHFNLLDSSCDILKDALERETLNACFI